MNTEKNLTKETIKIFWRHALNHKWAWSLIWLGVVIASIATVIQPFIYKQIFDLLASTDLSLAPRIQNTIILSFIVAFLSVAGWRLTHFAHNRFEPSVMSELLNTCYKYLQQHSYSFFSNNLAGSLGQKVNRYVRSFEVIFDNLHWSIGPTVLDVTAIFLVLAYRQKTLALVILIWSAFYIGVNYLFMRYKWKYDLERSEVDSATTGHLFDTIANNINLKLFNGLIPELKTYKALTKRLASLRTFTWNLDAIIEAFQSTMAIILEFLVFYLAVNYWQQGILSIGDFALLQAYVFRILDRVWDVGKNVRRIYEGLAEANEMTAILTLPHDVQDVPGAQPLVVRQGRVEFRRVSFNYNEQPAVLKDFNLDIASGERLAFVGPSGGGKTTLVKLLFRFLDIQQGSILIDGQDISQVSQESLRQNIALVPQEPILFHRSLMDNIRYGRQDASNEEVYAAAKAAHCHEFIDALPKKYETYVGERGIKLSGGERQRVAIARAILKNAPILVLDEATSSLDSESELLIQDALLTLMQGKTTIVIAHRLSTIRSMDRIVVIENGRITEQGKHEELVKAEQGTYQKLWEIQVEGFAAGKA